MPAEKQRLMVSHETNLEDDRSIGELGIKDGQGVFLVVDRRQVTLAKSSKPCMVTIDCDAFEMPHCKSPLSSEGMENWVSSRVDDTWQRFRLVCPGQDSGEPCGQEWIYVELRNHSLFSAGASMIPVNFGSFVKFSSPRQSERVLRRQWRAGFSCLPRLRGQRALQATEQVHCRHCRLRWCHICETTRAPRHYVKPQPEVCCGTYTDRDD